MCKHLISAFLQKHPLLPYFRCLVRNRRVEGGRGGRGDPPHPRLPSRPIKAGEGALTDFVPLLCPKFFVCLVIILCWRRNTIESQEKNKKTGHGKTGYFHGNEYERKQHYIHLENQQSLVKSVHFLSVGNLVFYD